MAEGGWCDEGRAGRARAISLSHAEYQLQSELPGTFEKETKLAILQPLALATHALKLRMPSLLASQAPIASTLQSLP